MIGYLHGYCYLLGCAATQNLADSGIESLRAIISARAHEDNATPGHNIATKKVHARVHGPGTTRYRCSP